MVREVGNEGPGPLQVLHPLDVGRLAGGIRTEAAFFLHIDATLGVGSLGMLL